jgi:cold shock CspA family protein
MTGVVARVLPHRSYGFVQPDDDTGSPIFFHADRLAPGTSFGRLHAGDAVVFEVGFDAHGRRQCVDLRRVGPARS